MREEEQFLAYDPVNNEYEYFETIEEAREYLKECFLDDDDGYHPDTEDFKIYKLYEKVIITELDSKENYKYHSEEEAIEANDEEALDKEDYWNHPDHWDFISKHEFKKVEESAEEITKDIFKIINQNGDDVSDGEVIDQIIEYLKSKNLYIERI